MEEMEQKNKKGEKEMRVEEKRMRVSKEMIKERGLRMWRGRRSREKSIENWL